MPTLEVPLQLTSSRSWSLGSRVPYTNRRLLFPSVITSHMHAPAHTKSWKVQFGSAACRYVQYQDTIHFCLWRPLPFLYPALEAGSGPAPWEVARIGSALSDRGGYTLDVVDLLPRRSKKNYIQNPTVTDQLCLQYAHRQPLDSVKTTTSIRRAVAEEPFGHLPKTEIVTPRACARGVKQSVLSVSLSAHTLTVQKSPDLEIQESQRDAGIIIDTRRWGNLSSLAFQALETGHERYKSRVSIGHAF